MKMLRRISVFIAAVAAALVGTAFVMALSPAPRFERNLSSLGCTDDEATRCLKMRDGATLHARRTGASEQRIVLLLHGVMASSEELQSTATMLRDTAAAEVWTLDLRGHGHSSGARGDIVHIGQYEEDVADVVSTLRKRHPRAKIILAGHSMGGGIAMRYAARRDVPAVDAYLLLAPHLGMSAPTTRTKPSGKHRGEPMMKVHLARTVGLIGLNALGIHALDGLDTLFFNVPDHLPLRRYSYRAMVSTSPQDHRAALTADAKPLLVLVGANDEAFLAEQYASVVKLHRNGRAVVIPGATHDGITRNATAMQVAADWMKGV